MHNKYAGREGVFETAINFICSPAIPINGIMVSHAFSYEVAKGDFFLSWREIVNVFQRIYKMRKRFPFLQGGTCGMRSRSSG